MSRACLWSLALWCVCVAPQAVCYADTCDSERVTETRGRLLAAHAADVGEFGIADVPALRCLSGSSEALVIVRRRARSALADLDVVGACEVLVDPYFSRAASWSEMERVDALSYLRPCFGRSADVLLIRELLRGRPVMARAAWRQLAVSHAR